MLISFLDSVVERQHTKNDFSNLIDTDFPKYSTITQ